MATERASWSGAAERGSRCGTGGSGLSSEANTFLIEQATAWMLFGGLPPLLAERAL